MANYPIIRRSPDRLNDTVAGLSDPGGPGYGGHNNVARQASNGRARTSYRLRDADPTKTQLWYAPRSTGEHRL